jgi:hypothetical protein
MFHCQCHAWTSQSQSGRKGLGGVISDQWFPAWTLRCYCCHDIQFKEIFAILHAILCWGDSWSGHHIVFFCNNSAVIAWMNSGTAKSPHAMPVLWAITMLATCLNFSYSSVWISTEENSLADAASCFQYTRLFQLALHLPHKPLLQKSHLIGMKCTLTCRPMLPYTSGMALPLAPAQLTLQVKSPTLTLSALNPVSLTSHGQVHC